MEITVKESGKQPNIMLVQTIKCGKEGESTITSLCPKRIPETKRRFLVKRIEKEGRKMPFWDFDANWPRFAKKSESQIAIIDGAPVIGVVQHDRLVMAIPVSKLGAIAYHKSWYNNGYWYPHTTIENVVALKQEVANQLNVSPYWNKAEQHFLEVREHEEAEEKRLVAEALEADMRASTENVVSGVAALQEKFDCVQAA